MAAPKPIVLAAILLVAALAVRIASDHASAGATVDAERIDGIVERAMARSNTTGLSLAIAYRGQLIHAQAYGHDGAGTPLRTTHRFRIASVSKPLTAIEIMRLVDDGRLRLDQRVFGPGSILGERVRAVGDPRVRDITIQHLLEHTAGGWDNDDGDGTPDPIALQPQLDRDQLVAWVVRNGALERAPGTVHQYSNIGYAILGSVIEEVTGRPYADVMRDDVVVPADARSMALAGRSRLADEVTYTQIGAGADAPYSFPMGRLDALGGWVATPTDLVRVADSGSQGLSADALATMTTPTTAAGADGGRAHYAKGWAVNEVLNSWHTGLLPGTSSLLVRTADGFTWAAITNSNHTDQRLDLDLDALMWKIVRSAVSLG